MSVMIVQVGQCGNQLGEVLWQELAKLFNVNTSSSSSRSKFVGNKEREGAGGTTTQNSNMIPNPFFSSKDGKARCVLIDSEPKVVQAVLQRNTHLFRVESSVVGTSGRGNNWSMGYNYGIAEAQTQHQQRQYGGVGVQFSTSPSRQLTSVSPPSHSKNQGSKGGVEGGAVHHAEAFKIEIKDQRSTDINLLGRSLRAIHYESLRVEDGGLEAIIVIHSFAGGTGSGLGCRLLELLRRYFTFQPHDEKEDHEGCSSREREQEEAELSELGLEELAGLFGQRSKALNLVSLCVAPKLLGETATQSMNSTLTLDVLCESVDLTILLRNDDTPSSKTFQDANLYFVQLLLPLLVGSAVSSGNPSSETSPPGESMDDAENLNSNICLPFGAISDLITKCAPDPRRSILTLVPISAKHLLRYTKSAIASYVFYCNCNHMSVVDQSSFFLPHFLGDESSKRNNVMKIGGGKNNVKNSYQAAFQWNACLLPQDKSSSSVSCGFFGNNKKSTKKTTPFDLQTNQILKNLEAAVATTTGGTIVLNQSEELCRNLLFPLLKDCALKIDAKAYVHRFEGNGTSIEEIQSALRRVVQRLVDYSV